jgi:hypothetical protein
MVEVDAGDALEGEARHNDGNPAKDQPEREAER